MIDDLFQAIREAASTKTWSDGVALSRQDVVTGDHEGDDDIILRVLNPQTGISATVTLWPADEDWHCDIEGRDDPNMYVVAAVIALKRAREAGKSLPRSQTAAGHLSYELHEDDRALILERWVVDGDKRELLTGPLSSYTSQRLSGPRFSATSLDMEVELALGAERRGALSPKTWLKVLPKLAKVPHLSYQEQALSISLEPKGLMVHVTDDGPRIRVEAKKDAALSRSFRNGVALAGSTLHPLLDMNFPQPLGEILSQGRSFGRQEWAWLASEILPALAARTTLLVEATQLPQASDGRARLDVQTAVLGERLQISPRIVYGDPVVAYVDNDHLVSVDRQQTAVRDKDRERLLRDQLSRELGLTLGQSSYVSGPEAVSMAQRLRQWRADEVSGPGLRAFTVMGTLSPQFTYAEGGIFSLHFALDGQDGQKTAGSARAQDVLKAWRQGESLVPLLDGGMATLPMAWLSRHGEACRELLALKEAHHGRLPLGAQSTAAQLASELGVSLSPALTQWRERLETIHDDGPWQAPPDLQASLRPYQEQGARWLARLQALGMGALLADDMGLGKTLQTIAIMQGPALVIAPTSVLYNWQKEITRFRPQLRSHIYHGANRRLDPHADVTLTTYGVLRQDRTRLAATTWRCIVVDEAQNIKNPESQVSQAVLALKGDMRIALSGTPVENSLDDLWSQMQFLNPGLLGPQSAFRERFAKAGADSTALVGLRQRISPFFLRRLKKHVAKDLPQKTETVLWTELSDHERSQYESLRALVRQDVRAALGADSNATFVLLELLLRLRQAANHLGLVPGFHADSSSKLETLLETLRSILAEDHKVIVVSQWTSFLDLIANAITRETWSYLRLDGSTNQRQDVVDRFQNSDESRILLLSLKAGGVGLNLTAADHVIIMDPWWNPAAEDQAADRAYRIGQDRPVFVHKMISKGTVEEKILALQEAKRHLAAGVAGETLAVPRLSREELMALLDD